MAFLQNNFGRERDFAVRWVGPLFMLGVLSLSTVIEAKSLTQAIETQQQSQIEAIASQKKISKLDAKTQVLLGRYRQDSLTLEDLMDYNAQLERQLLDQQQEIARKEAELVEIEHTHRRIVPFMLRMMEVFEQFVELDLPFLPDERAMRTEQLKGLMDRADVTVAEKYRRMLEAYRIEARYGHNIEAYQGTLEHGGKAENGGKARTVEFLRLGRIGLFYLTLDGREAGSWLAQEKRWLVLDDEHRKPIKQALLIAKKQLPPNLVKLPLPAPEVAQ